MKTASDNCLGVIGGLHLEPIRQWGLTHLTPVAPSLGASLHLPFWHVDCAVLAAELDAAPVRCTVSAVDTARVGEAPSWRPTRCKSACSLVF